MPKAFSGYFCSTHFIALIHPIQWTIAYPVGTDRPAKRPSDLSDKPVEKRKKEEKKKDKKATTSKKPDKSVKSSHRPRRILLTSTEIALGQCTRRADITPMNVQIGSLTLRNRTDRHGKTYPLTASTDAGKENISIPHDQPRASSRINDNYYVTSLKARLLAGSTPKETLTVQSLKTNVNLNVVNHVHSATGHPQRKGISPGLSAVNLKGCTLKHVKGASSVIQLPCVQSVTKICL